MDMLDIIAEPVRYAERSGEHSRRVHQIVRKVQQLAGALLSGDGDPLKAAQEEISGLRIEAAQIKQSLFDQTKHVHFRSPGGYAFSRYLACQDRIADAAQDLVDLSASGEIVIPVDLQADFTAFVTGVVEIGDQTMTLAVNLSAGAECTLSDAQLENLLNAAHMIPDHNRLVKRLGIKLARQLHAPKEPAGGATLMLLDRCIAAFQKIADEAEQTCDHLRLIFR
jgi:uncharacterized protein